MSEKDESAQPPATRDLQKLTRAAKKCLVCEFAKRSTQTVFGEGGSRASIMIVGEVPGDIEDRKGHPFVGAAEVLPSWHPSAVLRAPNESKRAKMREELKADLKKAWRRVQTGGQT